MMRLLLTLLLTAAAAATAPAPSADDFAAAVAMAEPMAGSEDFRADARLIEPLLNKAFAYRAPFSRRYRTALAQVAARSRGTAACSDRSAIDINGRTRSANGAMMPTTLPATFATLPNLFLPTGIAEYAIPVGALLEDPPNSEGRLLAIGPRLETIITNAIARIRP